MRHYRRSVQRIGGPSLNVLITVVNVIAFLFAEYFLIYALFA